MEQLFSKCNLDIAGSDVVRLGSQRVHVRHGSQDQGSTDHESDARDMGTNGVTLGKSTTRICSRSIQCDTDDLGYMTGGL